MKKTIRLHDHIYNKLNRYNKTKNINKLILKIIKKNYKKNQNIIDIGCANGELLYYLNKNLKKVNLAGIDIRKDLINKAKNKLPTINFKIGSVRNKRNLGKNIADISICIGVLGIFDNFENIINNLIYCTKPKGTIIVQVSTNKNPLDVNIRYSHSNNWGRNGPKFYETGWNIFSLKSLKKFLNKKINIKSFYFHEHKINFDLKKKNKDPVRSWTAKIDGKKKLINGLNLIIEEYLLIIKKR